MKINDSQAKQALKILTRLAKSDDEKVALKACLEILDRAERFDEEGFKNYNWFKTTDVNEN